MSRLDSDRLVSQAIPVPIAWYGSTCVYLSLTATYCNMRPIALRDIPDTPWVPGIPGIEKPAPCSRMSTTTVTDY
ncbi:hypothetical protein RRG08_025106 [Elysia crispata]|uniref:Uncharacterized protein n=1 Tax=Elysia crispata TaxID=231223 RepID=A0AAE1AJN6_9GAST|nr:hypothetical protein RRG08_025106 [Elysia crispata]